MLITLPAQDLSLAGEQSSMMGERTVLIKEVFRLWDEATAMGRPVTMSPEQFQLNMFFKLLFFKFFTP